MSAAAAPEVSLREVGGGSGVRRRALLIGCNYEGTSAALKGCHNDALALRKLLVEQLGFPDDDAEIRVLIDSPDQPENRTSNRANMIKGMRWLVKGATPDSSLFFSFSGHGGQTEDLDGDEDDGLDETLLPSDYATTGALVDDDLFRLMIKPLPEGCRFTSVIDACHSGTGLDLPYEFQLTAGEAGEDPKKWKMQSMTKKELKKLKKAEKKAAKAAKKAAKKGDKEVKKDKKDKDDKKDKKKDKKDKDDKKDKKDKKDKDDKKDKKKDKKKTKKVDDDGHGEDVGLAATAAQIGDGGGSVAAGGAAERAALGDAVLFSGCADDQTSADTNAFSDDGSSGGAMTNAFIDAMTKCPSGSSYADLLLHMRKFLAGENDRNHKFTQEPQLSSSQPLALTSAFSI